MEKKLLKASGPLKGRMTVPGDKSISHRAVMLGAISDGVLQADGFLNGADCLSTISCFRQMGVEIGLSEDQHSLTVHGRGLYGLHAPDRMLDTGNSGTTTRILTGILAAQHFDSELSGDESIEKRPMNRVMVPLRAMGADIRSIRDNGCAPLLIHGAPLHGVYYDSPVASAQVKSAVLLGGLYADGPVVYTEPSLSRDHTERLLKAMGADIETKILPDGRAQITLTPGNALKAPARFSIPGDISSAAYFISAALLVPGSDLCIQNVGINPTRSGILDVYRNMGADLEILSPRLEGGEETADIRVRYSRLHGTEIGGSLIPRLIDELPVIMAVSAFAEGSTRIRDAQELKVKESNRLAVLSENFHLLGIRASETDDGMYIEGNSGIPCPARIRCHKDHRIAMSFAVLSLLADGIVLDDADCVSISYPGFFSALERLL